MGSLRNKQFKRTAFISNEKISNIINAFNVAFEQFSVIFTE